jgi:hypothetical protein
MIGRSSVDLTSFHNDKFNMLAKALVTTDSETLLYGRATLDLDGENILTSPSETTASAVLDIDKSNYLTMEMEMITDGDMSGGDNDRHSLSCMHADMYMEDPMHLKALDLNMTTSLFLMNNANNGFRGVVVEDHNVGIALREYPSDFTQAQCEATMQISMKMVSYGRSGATIVAAPSQQPTTHPTMHPSMQPTSPCPGGPCGFCYSGRSTVAVKVPRKSGIMISKPLHQVFKISFPKAVLIYLSVSSLSLSLSPCLAGQSWRLYFQEGQQDWRPRLHEGACVASFAHDPANSAYSHAVQAHSPLRWRTHSRSHNSPHFSEVWQNLDIGKGERLEAGRLPEHTTGKQARGEAAQAFKS